jgi:hypothetical protein
MKVRENTADDPSRGPLTAINKTMVVNGYHLLTCSKKTDEPARKLHFKQTCQPPWSSGF